MQLTDLLRDPRKAQQIVRAVRRRHFQLFVMKVFETLHPGENPIRMSWYIQAMCHRLEQMAAGECRRLVITVPPRHLKSITASVAYVAWLLGRDPSIKIMVASYSQDLARLHSNLTRTIMESAWYLDEYPQTRISDRGNRALELETTAGGVRKAVSVSGSITGFGADLIILDDCMKADDANSSVVREETRSWFDNTLLSRLNDKATGRILSIQQRLHEDDLPAYLLSKGYEHLNLPAIAQREEVIPIGEGKVHCRQVGDLLNPEREPKEVLDQLRRDMGPAVFSAQYQQDPVAPEGNLIRMEWFGTYDERPERHEFLKVVQSWDTGMSAAPTSDYSVCTTWGFGRDDKKWFLLDVFRKRLDFPDLKRAVIQFEARWGADQVLIEDACSGKSLWQELRATSTFVPIMIKPDRSKEERFTGCLAEVEAGNILLPIEAPWLDLFRGELKAFPAVRHDDQVDSFSQFVNWQVGRWRWVLNGRSDRNIRLSRARLPLRPY
jgi:predicted phage terminase large subunit-like protein